MIQHILDAYTRIVLAIYRIWGQLDPCLDHSCSNNWYAGEASKMAELTEILAKENISVDEVVSALKDLPEWAPHERAGGSIENRDNHLFVNSCWCNNTPLLRAICHILAKRMEMASISV